LQEFYIPTRKSFHPVNLTFYYKNEKYDSVAKNNLYGMKVLAELWSNNSYEKSSLNIALDTGYQQFVDINNTFNLPDNAYNDTPYVKIGLEYRLASYVYIDLSAKFDKNAMFFGSSFVFGNFWGMRLEMGKGAALGTNLLVGLFRR
jgi:hypothetical protein